MANKRWSRETLLPAPTIYNPTTQELKWADREKEKMFPRAKQRSTPPPATEKLVWPPPSISDALYGESKPTVDGKSLSLDNLNSYFRIQENKSKAVEELKELLKRAKSEPELPQVNTYGEGYGDEYGEKYGAVGERPDTMSFHTCSDLCKPLLGAGSDFDECHGLCNLIYQENPMAARGRTRRHKYKKTKKKKTHRKKKRTRKTRKR